MLRLLGAVLAVPQRLLRQGQGLGRGQADVAQVALLEREELLALGPAGEDRLQPRRPNAAGGLGWRGPRQGRRGQAGQRRRRHAGDVHGLTSSGSSRRQRWIWSALAIIRHVGPTLMTAR